MPELTNETPTCSPPWYATPDASTPGEKFFTPSLGDKEEGRRFSINSEAHAGADSEQVKKMSATESDKPAAVPLEQEPAREAPLSVQTSGQESKPVTSDGNNSADNLQEQISDPEKSSKLGHGVEAARRPISIGQEDEFILLPAFNPDFDEIFTSLTKYVDRGNHEYKRASKAFILDIASSGAV